MNTAILASIGLICTLNLSTIVYSQTRRSEVDVIEFTIIDDESKEPIYKLDAEAVWSTRSQMSFTDVYGLWVFIGGPDHLRLSGVYDIRIDTRADNSSQRKYTQHCYMLLPNQKRIEGTLDGDHWLLKDVRLFAGNKYELFLRSTLSEKRAAQKDHWVIGSWESISSHNMFTFKSDDTYKYVVEDNTVRGTWEDTGTAIVIEYDLGGRHYTATLDYAREEHSDNSIVLQGKKYIRR